MQLSWKAPQLMYLNKMLHEFNTKAVSFENPNLHFVNKDVRTEREHESDYELDICF